MDFECGFILRIPLLFNHGCGGWVWMKLTGRSIVPEDPIVSNIFSFLWIIWAQDGKKALSSRTGCSVFRIHCGFLGLILSAKTHQNYNGASRFRVSIQAQLTMKEHRSVRVSCREKCLLTAHLEKYNSSGWETLGIPSTTKSPIDKINYMQGTSCSQEKQNRPHLLDSMYWIPEILQTQKTSFSHECKHFL